MTWFCDFIPFYWHKWSYYEEGNMQMRVCKRCGKRQSFVIVKKGWLND